MTATISGYNEVTRRRVARTPHRCGTCSHQIRVGDVHLEHVAFPGHDALGLGATRPSRMRECARCATRYGREHALDMVGYEQCARDGLL